MLEYKAIFRSGDRLSGSTYGEPIFGNLNIPNLNQLQEYRFVKVFLSDALINADISGNDESHVCVQIKNKQPINLVRSSGSGSSLGASFLGMVPFVLKESGQAGLYYLTHSDERSYLVFGINDFQDTNLELLLSDGSNDAIEDPGQDRFSGWTVCLTMRPVKSLED